MASIRKRAIHSGRARVAARARRQRAGVRAQRHHASAAHCRR